jgi:hypothetical protein
VPVAAPEAQGPKAKPQSAAVAPVEARLEALKHNVATEIDSMQKLTQEKA